MGEVMLRFDVEMCSPRLMLAQQTQNKQTKALTRAITECSKSLIAKSLFTLYI
jgi:hypothetical protein